MVNKKGQGISISFIVVAAIAALVLVLVIAFATGGLGKFFSSIFQAGEGGQGGIEVSTAQARCKELCTAAVNGGYGAWNDSNYCWDQFGIDMSGDGVINSTTERFNCWEAPISERCTLTKTDAYGYGITCNHDNCGTPNGCPGTCCVGGVAYNPRDCEAIAGAKWKQDVSCP
ncbi:MAG: hypothetical protein JSW73_04920 [Candidatus Woesearchaeota archaeon]|nr:MAG: hypothetical protein JSW73_04920 [Candidatus Woesearchaeota archaeon]